MEGVERSPLRESSTNQLVTRFSPSKARANLKLREREQWQLPEKNQLEHHQQHQHVRQRHSNQEKSRRSGSDQQVREWQKQWRSIMTKHTAYFDYVDRGFVERVAPVLQSLKTSIAPFFDKNVTLIITARSLDQSYGSQDVLTIAESDGLKIWNVEKLVRFLTNLLGRHPFAQEQHKLSTILHEEKYAGPSDRDPTAKRKDMYYFKEEYLLVWDVRHLYKPTIIKDYDFKDLNEVRWWPTFNWTDSYRCPFQITQPAEKSDKVRRLKEERRMKHGAQSQATEDETEEETRAVRGDVEDEREGDEEELEQGKHPVELKAEEVQSQTEVKIQDVEIAEDAKSNKVHNEKLASQDDQNRIVNVGEEYDDADANKENEPYLGEAMAEGDDEREPVFKRKRDEVYGPNKSFKGDNFAKRLFFHEIRASGINRSNSTSATRSTMAVGEPLTHESKLAQYASREISGVFGAHKSTQKLSENMPPIRKGQTHEESIKKAALLEQSTQRVEQGAPEQVHQDDPNVEHDQKLPPVKLVPPQEQQAEPAPKKVQAKAAVAKENMGYCENCQVTFDDFQEHVNGKKHQDFANNPAKFVQLDILLQALKRV